MPKENTFSDRQNISHELVFHIKQQILKGELNPGDRIIETQMAKELGISQTPVREAIRQLSGEGIVTIVPNRGTIVKTFNDNDIFEIYSLRAVIEGLAIRLATQKTSDESISNLVEFFETMKNKQSDEKVDSLLFDSHHIHQSIIAMSNHSRLIEIYELISFQISLVNRILGTKSNKEKEVRQHTELISALQKRDPDNAEKIMREHIHRSYQEFIDLKKEKWGNKEGVWF